MGAARFEPPPATRFCSADIVFVSVLAMALPFGGG